MFGRMDVPVTTAPLVPWAEYEGAVIKLQTPGGRWVWMCPAPPSVVGGQYPDPQGRSICVITAWNPSGQVAAEADNASAQEELVKAITGRGWESWAAVGGNPSWTHTEDSVAVVGVDEAEVAALGAVFGQDAIFSLSPAGRRIVGCTGSRVITTGWVTEPGNATES